MPNIDFAPMFLDFAGDPPRRRRAAAFGPIWPAALRKGWRNSMYYRYWMHNDGDHHVPGHYGIRTKQYKLIYYYGKPLGMRGAHEPPTEPAWEFYDLRKDKREMVNRYSDPGYQKIIQKLKAEMDRLQKQAGDTPRRCAHGCTMNSVAKRRA